MLNIRIGINIQLTILCILLLIGNAVIPNVLILAFIYAIYIILKNNSENNYKLLFLLLPNVRILDGIGFNYAVNIIYLLIGIKYILERRKCNLTTYIAVMLLFIWELIHSVFYLNVGTFLFTIFNISFDLFIFLLLIEDNVIDFETDINYLSYGCFVSAFIYFLSNKDTITRLVTSVYRFEAYGNDPNYYSVYILVAITGLLICLKNKDKMYWKIIKIFILAFLGLLTSSKMYVLCFLGLSIAYVIMIFIQKERISFKALGRVILIAAILILLFHDYVSFFINKFLERFNETFYTTALGNFTTGRIDTLINYINILSKDWISLFFGRGAIYYQYYREHGFSYILAAHNTYFDILLSEGVIGVVFILLGYFIIVNKCLLPYKENRKLNYLPIIVFLVVIFGLSCYTTDMFWYLLLLTLIPLKKDIKNDG